MRRDHAASGTELFRIVVTITVGVPKGSSYHRADCLKFHIAPKHNPPPIILNTSRTQYHSVVGNVLYYEGVGRRRGLGGQF